MEPVHPVEAVVTLIHQSETDDTKLSRVGKTRSGRRGCGLVAHAVTLSYLQQIRDGEVNLVCNGCRKHLTLDDVTGDEPFVPEYQRPAGAI